ncbi:restriction endonuclease subunit S [Clostridium weizhouense]|uniref:Restriction endonuclease subunit S n=1 Tax=Clostridium weizhouense TaxID=2859781 RepID=A0ABS7AQW2_9CLOT|nr:restriction endonuclease subunit S [Clostridium weizhouense]MBW6411012.1 restriction endonuclease subunit S [Clostridium weizhouense]
MAKKKMTLEEKIEEAVVTDVPYEVPGNWINVKLGAVAKWGSGGTPSRKHSEYYDGEIPWIKTGELNNGYIYDSEEKITHEAINKSSAKIFKKGSVLIAMYGATIGKVAILGVDATTNQACAAAECYEVVNNKFLFYYLLSQKENFIDLGKGGAQPNISQAIIKEYTIPLPTLKEQHRIVNRIENLFEKLDKAKELIEEARDGFEKRKAAILEKAFRGELTNDYRMKNNMAYNWSLNKLKNVAKITSGGTPSRKRPEYFEGEIPWIKTGEIIWSHIYDSEEHITQEAIDNSSAKLIPSGSVLVAMYGQGLTRGRAAILLGEACTNQAVCALIPTEKIRARYLYYYFMKNYWNFRQLAKGGNQENLSGKVIGEFEIEIPSVEEQKEIVRILDKFLEEESKIDELTQLEEQIELIKKSILAKAFRGELGTNCEDEESALELLKEILSKDI